jgi:phage terminase small subunit
MLTLKQARFVEEYIVDLNGRQAAIRAGYSPKTAEVQASRLLRNAKLQATLESAIRERSKRAELSSDRVVEELARIADDHRMKGRQAVFSYGGPGRPPQVIPAELKVYRTRGTRCSRCIRSSSSRYRAPAAAWGDGAENSEGDALHACTREN